MPYYLDVTSDGKLVMTPDGKLVVFDIAGIDLLLRVTITPHLSETFGPLAETGAFIAAGALFPGAQSWVTHGASYSYTGRKTGDGPSKTFKQNTGLSLPAAIDVGAQVRAWHNNEYSDASSAGNLVLLSRSAFQCKVDFYALYNGVEYRTSETLTLTDSVFDDDTSNPFDPSLAYVRAHGIFTGTGWTGTIGLVRP